MSRFSILVSCWLIAVFFPLLANGQPPARQVLDNESRFGIDYVFPVSPLYRNEAWAERLAASGARWVNFSGVTWKYLEPRPPVAGKHEYRWAALDRAVAMWQRHHFDITIWLRLGGGWFAGPIRYTAGVRLPIFKDTDRLPKPEYRGDYRDFVTALVERYDGDGRDDAPGLLRPVLYYQFGNEYGNPMFWTGTIDDYIVWFQDSSLAARRACPDVQVVSTSLRWNSFFHGNPTAENWEKDFKAFLDRQPTEMLRDGWRRNLEFNRASIALADYYDVLDVGGNGAWPGMSFGYAAWTRRELARTGKSVPLWDMEARCEPSLILRRNISFHPELTVPNGKQILDWMRDESATKHQDAVDWYRAEQARILVKVFVTRFAAGYEKVFMGMPSDWDQGLASLVLPNPYVGLLNRKGGAWPAFYAMRLLAHHIDQFHTVTSLEGDGAVEVYRFEFDDGRPTVWIAWAAEDHVRGMDDPLPKKRIRLNGLSGRISVWQTPTESSTPHPAVIDGNESPVIELSPTPVIIRHEPE